MNADRKDLEYQFSLLSDEELLHRGGTGTLTELAQAIAEAEARSRGLALPARPLQEENSPGDDAQYQGDLQIVARHLTPTEAHLLCACLHSGGIPAEPGDIHLMQMHSLLAGAVGGSCVRVPSSFVPEAMELIAAFRRGDFALEDDMDPALDR